MKHIPVVLVLLFFLCLSCKPDEKDELEGKWQLKEIVDENGNTSPVDTVWYNIMNSLFMYQVYDASQGEGGKYLREHGYKDWVTTDSVQLRMRSSLILEHSDWDTPSRIFRVNEVTGSALTLSGEGKTYRFIKF